MPCIFYTFSIFRLIMLSIGLTGGIGSGKSTVASIFEVLGVPVLYADEVGKDLMASDENIKSSIKELFGERAYSGNVLNRSFIASIVFQDPEMLKALNAVVHPATIDYTRKWIKLQKAPYIIKEAALLFESKSNEHTDLVIGVKSSLETRIKRAMQRSNITRDEILKRIGQQMDEDKKLSLCDYIISNEENELLIPQVLIIHQELLSKVAATLN